MPSRRVAKGSRLLTIREHRIGKKPVPKKALPKNITVWDKSRYVHSPISLHEVIVEGSVRRTTHATSTIFFFCRTQKI